MCNPFHNRSRSPAVNRKPQNQPVIRDQTAADKPEIMLLHISSAVDISKQYGRLRAVYQISLNDLNRSLRHVDHNLGLRGGRQYTGNQIHSILVAQHEIDKGKTKNKASGFFGAVRRFTHADDPISLERQVDACIVIHDKCAQNSATVFSI